MTENSDLSDFAQEGWGDEAAVAHWETAFPAAHRLYWTIRAAMEDQDGGRRRIHHAAAVFAVHDSFPGKPERARLGLPPTALELATRLGVSDRALRNYRLRYAAIYATTRRTLRDAFLGSYYGRVYEALGESATILGKNGSADRRLFMQIAGDLVDTTRRVNLDVDVADMTDEELDDLLKRLG